MQHDFSRRDLLVSSGASAAALGVLGMLGVTVAGADEPPAVAAPREEPWSNFPQQDQALVREMVTVSHFDLKRVKELVAGQPTLVNAAIDWGFGDWENALAAASHVGRREIAEFLIENGARAHIFAAAMLGWTEVVRAFVVASPGIQRTFGPHGITLLAHARAGGDKAKDTFDYLTALGDADMPTPTKPIDAESKRKYEGTYAYGDGERQKFVVKLEKEWLNLRRGETINRRLNFVGDNAFFPAGAPSVRVMFEMDGETSRGLIVVVDKVSVKAIRRG